MTGGLHDTDTMTRCRMVDRCRDFRLDPDLGRVGSPVVGPGGLCMNCSQAAKLAVQAARRHVDALAEQVVEPLRKPGTQRDPSMPRATWRERESPLDLAADALMRELAHELAVWAAAVDEDRGSTSAVGRWSGQSFGHQVAARTASAAAHLTHHWDRLLSLRVHEYRAHGLRARAEHTAHSVTVVGGALWTARDGGSAACVFLDIDRRVDDLLGLTIRPTRHHDPCPHPDCQAVGTVIQWPPPTPGDPSPMRCEHCGRDIDEATFDWWGRVLAAPARHTPAQLEAALYTGTSNGEAA